MIGNTGQGVSPLTLPPSGSKIVACPKRYSAPVMNPIGDQVLMSTTMGVHSAENLSTPLIASAAMFGYRVFKCFEALERRWNKNPDYAIVYKKAM